MRTHSHFDHTHHHPSADQIDALIQCVDRHGRHHSSSGNGGRHHGGRGSGDRHSPGGRVFARGELKLVLLTLISEHPRHGYELIRIIEDMFDGNYTPSPGAVYPTLTMLEEMGHTSVQFGDDGKKRYSITEAGRSFLKENKVVVDATMTRLEQSAKIYARMAIPDSIREHMHNLHHALRSHPWSSTEAKRVADILKRATNEIIDSDPGV